MSNEELIKAIKTDTEHEREYLAQLWEQNRGIIETAVRRFAAYSEYDDLMQEAYLGFYEAVQGFEVSRGYKFLTYAMRYVNQRLTRFVKADRLIHIPEHLFSRQRAYADFCEEYQSRTGKRPDAETIAAELGCTEATARLLLNGSMSQPASLDAPLNGADDEALTLGSVIAAGKDPDTDMAEHMFTEQRKRDVWETVETLPEEEAEVLKARYLHDMSIKETCVAIGFTKTQAIRHERRALEHLRYGKRKLRLLPYLDGLRSSAMRGVSAAKFKETWTSATEREALKLYG